MTTDEFNKKLDAKIALIQKENKPLFLAVKSVMALQSKRIFLDAKDNSEGSIGNYKGGELYVSVSKSPVKFTPKGKPVTGKKIKNRKSGYFVNYLAYKKAVGRNKRVPTVDLFLSGDLHRDWANAEIGAVPSATKIDANHYNVSLKDENYVKIEENFLDTFKLSVREKRIFLGVIQSELAKAMK